MGPTRKILKTGIVFAVFLVSLFFGWRALAVNFRTWDDEGYVLMSLYHHLAGGHLYTEVFTEYGPFFFFAEDAFFRLLHLPVTHDSGRLITLVLWLISAGAAGWSIYKITKNTVLASAAVLAAMSLGRVLANEPNHPQQIIFPIFMLACCAAASSGPMGLLWLGALGSALFFTKINVGVFYFAAVALVLVCQFPRGRIRTIGGGLLLAYAGFGPFLLMHRDVPGSAARQCLVAVLCGVPVFWAGLLTTPAAVRPMRSVLYVAAGAMSAAALIVIGVMMQGIPLSALLDGVVRLPLRHPGVFKVPQYVSKLALLSDVLVTAGIFSLYRFRDRWRTYADWIDAVRCVAALCILAKLVADLDPSNVVVKLPSLVVFLPLGLVPAGDREWTAADYFPRLFIAGLAATQFLQPYPVAGSHLNIAAAPLLLWTFLCIHDGLGGFVRLAPVLARWPGKIASRESAVGGLIVVILGVVMLRAAGWPGRYAYPASSLQGTSSLHLDPDLEATYESLAGDINANCNVLFSLPGMGSLNLWSGVPTPNGKLLGPWMRALSAEEQQEILDLLKKDPNACVVYNEKIALGWGPTVQDMEALPLPHHIIHDMPKVAERQGYEIHVHPQRTSPWVEAVR